ncbi:MAG: ComF family protein [Mogibacterium sp.]|nr:ComF family protein [Mogibacterium sp.]
MGQRCSGREEYLPRHSREPENYLPRHSRRNDDGPERLASLPAVVQETAGWLRKAGGSVLDLIYPPALYCICCGKIIDETRPYRLCNDCMDSVKWADGRTCEVCGKPLGENNPGTVCYYCKSHTHRFTRAFTCAEYGMHERAVVFAMKYGAREDIAGTLAEILHDRLELLRMSGEMPEYDLIVPVPMYLRKLRERGFNQTDLIAKALSRLEGKPWDPGVVRRTRDTKAMRGLSPDERQHNIQGAFEVPDTCRETGALSGLTVLVIDDLYTTGNTADAMAAVLREAGAREVYFLTFAAGADLIKSE